MYIFFFTIVINGNLRFFDTDRWWENPHILENAKGTLNWHNHNTESRAELHSHSKQRLEH